MSMRWLTRKTGRKVMYHPPQPTSADGLTTYDIYLPPREVDEVETVLQEQIACIDNTGTRYAWIDVPTVDSTSTAAGRE